MKQECRTQNRKRYPHMENHHHSVKTKNHILQYRHISQISELHKWRKQCTVFYSTSAPTVSTKGLTIERAVILFASPKYSLTINTPLAVICSRLSSSTMKLSEDLICSMASGQNCLDRITGLIKSGHRYNPATEPCPSGFYMNDKNDCLRCPYGMSSISGSSQCGASMNFASPGLHVAFIPLNVTKINVKLRGGNGHYMDNEEAFTLGGGFSSCNITVPANSTLYVIVGGGSPTEHSEYSRFFGENLRIYCYFSAVRSASRCSRG